MEESQFNIAKEKLFSIIKDIKANREIRSNFQLILNILNQYPDLVEFLSLDTIKTHGLRSSLTEFLELLDYFEPGELKEIIDRKMLLFLCEIIYNYIEKERINYLQMDRNEDSEKNNDHHTSNHTNENESNIFNFQNTECEPNESEELHYIDYIDDENVVLIIKLFEKMFKDEKNIYLLTELYNLGFFDLMNVIITDQVCSLYENIFFMKKYGKEVNRSVKPCTNMPIYEIQRKMFLGQMVVKEKRLNDRFYFKEQFNLCADEIYTKIIDIIFNTNIFYFFQDCRIKRLVHTCNFYFSFKKEHFEFVYDDDIITDLQKLIIQNDTCEYITLYVNILKNITENRNVITVKMLSNNEMNNKIHKLFEGKDLPINKEIALYYYYFLEAIIKYNSLLLVDEIEISDYIKEIGKECNINKITDLLNYEIEEKAEITKLLSILYNNGVKTYFYKISSIILIRNIMMEIDRDFSKTVLKDFLEFMESSHYNFSRILFPFEEKKVRAKKPKIHDDELINSADDKSLDENVDVLEPEKDKTEIEKENIIDDGDSDLFDI